MKGLGGGWEQFWRGIFRMEVKFTREAERVIQFHDDTKAQSDKDHSFGDWRPYVAVAGREDRICIVVDVSTTDKMDAFAYAWVEARERTS